MVSGHIERLRGQDRQEYEQAGNSYRACLRLFEELEDTAGIADVGFGLELVAHYEDDFPEAAARYGKSLRLFRAMGDVWSIAITSQLLCYLAWTNGEHENARKLYEESLALKQQLNDKRGMAFSLRSLGDATLHEGDTDRATESFANSLELIRELGDRRGMAEMLIGFAAIARARGQMVRSARLFGAVERMAATLHAPLRLGRPIEQNEHRVAVLEALGPQAFTAAYDEGALMGSERALAYAVEIAP